MKNAAIFVGLVVGVPMAGIAGPPPAELDGFYRMASGYEVAANHRICADASLQPRLSAASVRMAHARRMLINSFGSRFNASPPPVVMPSTVCADPHAAANAVVGFEQALARLETALVGVPRE